MGVAVLVLTVLLLAGMLFGVAAVSVGHGSPLSDTSVDRREPLLPADPVSAADVESLRFTMALRGYRMDEVDAVLERLSTELSVRDAEIGRLRSGVGVGAPSPAGESASGSQPSPLDGPQAADRYAPPDSNAYQGPGYDAGAYEAPLPYDLRPEPGTEGHGA
jgi:DivIVA domain-containing protein